MFELMAFDQKFYRSINILAIQASAKVAAAPLKPEVNLRLNKLIFFYQIIFFSRLFLMLFNQKICQSKYGVF